MSSAFSGLDLYPGMLERKPGLIDLVVQMRDRHNVSGALLVGSWHFHHLYGPRTNSQMGGAAPVADIDQRSPLLHAATIYDGGTARSPVALSRGLKYGRRRAGVSSDATRSFLRFVFDLNDFDTVSGGKRVLPSDDQMLFVSLMQTRPSLSLISGAGFTGRFSIVQGATDNGDFILGPILPIPPASWWTIPEPNLILTGEAPSIGGGTAAMGASGTFPAPDPDLQIPNPLHFVLPFPTTSITIHNTEAGGGPNLRVSHGLGHMIYEVTPGESRTFFGAVKEICLMSADAAATCTFAIEANINLGGAAGGV